MKVSILEEHMIVDTDIYGIIRHPAYLGHLTSLLGIGLILGNWVGLAALVVIRPAGILYRIHVDEGEYNIWMNTLYAAQREIAPPSIENRNWGGWEGVRARMHKRTTP